MLTTIVKRNGSIVPFNLEKLHNWVIWAGDQLGDRINWSEIVLETLSKLKEGATTVELQKELIKSCTNKGDYAHNLMAGRLFAAVYRKEIFGKIEPPTIKELHQKLFDLGLMVKLNYTDEEYDDLEKIINHQQDFEYACFQLLQLKNKYALRNAATKEIYETPQFIFMRMAMALAENEPDKTKLRDVKNWYKYFSLGKLSAPTPNYTNLGTSHRGYASCCLVKADDNLNSMSAADHVVYRMSANAAGIGTHYAIRSVGDPVRHGLIKHGGKLPYMRAQAALAKSNLQNSARGGAINQFVSCYDPEIFTIIRMQNPTTVKTVQIRESHFTIMYNTFFARKAAKREKVFHFNAYTAPELYEAMFDGDQQAFEQLYTQYEDNKEFKKIYFDPRELIIEARKEAFACGTLYQFNTDIANKQTPFKDKIYSSNLCLEVMQPTEGYDHITDLFSEDEKMQGEVSICSLAAIVVPSIKSEKEYEQVAYYALKMIDRTIDLSDHPLPNIKVKSRLRRNAGVGMIGIATSIAKAKLKFDTEEGLKFAHELAERHYYYCLKASLKLGKELGNAGWTEKSKYPDGWFAHEHAAPEVQSFPLKYDWELLRKEIIENGGLRNSILINHMPTESSSKSSGYPNGIYPVRETAMKKSDADNSIDWVAYDNDKLDYQSAWDIETENLIKYYGIIQKFTDGGISADFYKDRSEQLNVSTADILKEHVAMIKYGLKSRYYQNTKTSGKTIFDVLTKITGNNLEEILGKEYCESCSL